MTTSTQTDCIAVRCTLDEHILLSAPGGLLHRVLRASGASLTWDVTEEHAVLEVPRSLVPNFTEDCLERTALETEFTNLLSIP